MTDTLTELREPKGAIAQIVKQSGEPTRLGALAWYPIGVGFYPTENVTSPYNRANFERLARDPNSLDLARARADFVERHYKGSLCDYGIGSGAFMIARRNKKQNTWGYDVSAYAQQWLDSRNALIDPNLVPFPAISMWGTLAHIEDFSKVVANCKDWLFVSVPLFDGAAQAIKTLDPEKHCWYFSGAGLVLVMEQLGFDLVAPGVKIYTENYAFAFRRRKVQPDMTGKVVEVHKMDFKNPVRP